MGTYFYQPCNGHGLPHDPFKAIVAPRPIGWISSCDADGRPNLAPYSFFNAFASSPPVVGFASEGHKDSVANIEATGEFVCNLVGMELAQQMNATSATVAHGVDEMTLAGLAAAPCRVVRPPRVAAAGAALECRLLQVIRLNHLDGRPRDNWVVLGEVVGVHIAERLLKGGRFDTAAARPVARCGYRSDYAVVTELFEMVRPA